MRFKYFDHTADVKFQAYGSTLEEAFSNSALAMFNLLTKTDEVKPVMAKAIRIRGKSHTTLLYDFLEKLIVGLDVDNFVPNRVDSLTISEKDGLFELSATMSGDDIAKYPTSGDIKAVTYNDMRIDRKGGAFTIQVVLDI